MQFFFDLVIGGFSIGACYALVALSMVIIYKTSEVPNFAQGEMAMVSTFVAFTLISGYGIGFGLQQASLSYLPFYLESYWR